MADYQLARCTLDEYVSRGGKPSRFFDSSVGFYLAYDSEGVVGEIAFKKDFAPDWPPHYFIMRIQSYRENVGIGSALVTAVESEAIDNSFSLIGLRFNKPNLWERLGYVIDSDCHLAWKRLGVAAKGL